MPRSRVTIGDVAKASGVSVATVSRALLDYPQVNAQTRQRVIRTVRALGYVPNRAAQSLVVRSTQTLGLLIPDATDPIHGQVVAGFEQEAAAQGYTVILANGFDTADRERRALELFVMHRADGVALIGSVLPQREVRTRVRPSPIVFVNGEHPGLAGYDSDLPLGCLRGDDVKGIEAAVHHLHERGFRSLAYVGGPASASDITRREAAARAVKRLDFRSALRSYVSQAEPWQVDTTAAAVLVKNRHDAVLCFDDKLALSLMEGLRARGARVPGDIALVGFDDIPFARLANPSLTTIAQPSVELGRRAAAMLLEAIREDTLPRSERLPVHLVVRASTGRNGTATSGRSRRKRTA